MSNNPERIYAFIDSNNIHLGVKSQGWRLDWFKFRQYLRTKYNVTQAYTFIGNKPGNEELYTRLKQYSYKVILKPIMELSDGTVKGNVDAELVLHTMIEYENYDRAIIVSGDGDFRCLIEYLAERGKLLHLITPNRYSKLYKEFSSYIIQIDRLRGSLE